MGYLLLAAVMTSLDLFGNPFILIGQALGLTGLTAFGMMVYLLTGPKLNYIAAIMPMLGLPMIVLMVISFVFPVTGTFGILLSGAFVAFSAIGLLYQLNVVIHKMPAEMATQASFEVMIGLLVLFGIFYPLSSGCRGGRGSPIRREVSEFIFQHRDTAHVMKSIRVVFVPKRSFAFKP